MRQIAITEIRKTNYIFDKYKKTISFWDNEGTFLETMDESTNSLYAVIYDDIFLGASTILFDADKQVININVIIGSTGHKEEIENYFTEQLIQLANKRYETDSVVLNNKREKSNVLVKTM